MFYSIKICDKNIVYNKYNKSMTHYRDKYENKCITYILYNNKYIV